MFFCGGSWRTTRPAVGRDFLQVCVLSSLFLAVACGSGARSSIVQPPPPSYTLKASPSSASIQQGGSGTTTVQVAPQNGFSGSVDLAASGLANGVTASFNPPSTASTSTVTFTVSTTASLGTVTVTITGTSGALTATTTIDLTVFAPPPPGSLPASFFALNNVEPSDDPAKDGMSYGAVGHPIRLAWPYIETSRGVFDFSFYDQYAAIAPREADNVAVMDLTLGMTPGWAKADQSTCRSLPGGVIGCQAPPDNIQDWKDFITALVRHYDGAPATPHIKYYEIWNEWNVQDANNGFWMGTPVQLAAMQTTACAIIHATDALSMVLTPSTVGPAATPNDQAPLALQTYFNFGGSNCPGGPNNMIDGVSFHGNLGLMSLNPYPLPDEGCSVLGCNGTIVQITDSYREVLKLNGLPTVPLLDTEGGFEAADITDIDQRAAWLAQFYVLQAGLFNNEDQLRWVSWFTWGPPGVAGNIETANKTPDPAGVAYNQVYNWLFGRFPSACTQNGRRWTCDVTGAAGYQAEILWDDSQTCNNGACTTSPQPVPSWAVKYRTLAGNSTQITSGTVPVGLKPIIVENQ